jgi:hypothetical protein
MQEHLRTYVDNGIQQKVRLSNLILDYKDQENKSKERVVDQFELRNKMVTQGTPQNKIDLIDERSNIDSKIHERVQKILEQTKTDMDGLTLRMNAHLEELTAIEILSGGFIAHSVGIDEHTTFDEDNKIISFKPGGHVEIAIAARLNKWKDSSQLTIKKIKKAGV